MTQRWACRVFAFLLAITEVNVYLVFKSMVYVGDLASFLPDHVQFRRKLAWQLIDNQWLPKDDVVGASEDRGLPGVQHDICSAPPHATEYRNRKWRLGAKAPYQQYTCRWPECATRCRTCCPCTPGVWLCPSHVVEHSVVATRKAFVE